MRISDWSSDVCSSDLVPVDALLGGKAAGDVVGVGQGATDVGLGDEGAGVAVTLVEAVIGGRMEAAEVLLRPHLDGVGLDGQQVHGVAPRHRAALDRKSTRLNSSH